jgi:hypothetical protein
MMHLGARTNPVFMEEFIGLYQNHLDRVEERVRSLLDHQDDSAQGLWTIQTDLARYQIELRSEIGQEGDKQKELKTETHPCKIGIGLSNVRQMDHVSEMNVTIRRGILKQRFVLKGHDLVF